MNQPIYSNIGTGNKQKHRARSSVKAQKIDHICIAGRELEKAQKVYEETLDGELDSNTLGPRIKSQPVTD
jgi:hypothetical protein